MSGVIQGSSNDPNLQKINYELSIFKLKYAITQTLKHIHSLNIRHIPTQVFQVKNFVER